MSSAAHERHQIRNNVHDDQHSIAPPDFSKSIIESESLPTSSPQCRRALDHANSDPSFLACHESICTIPKIKTQWVPSSEFPNWTPRVACVIVDALLDDPIIVAVVPDKKMRYKFLYNIYKCYIKFYCNDSWVLVQDDATFPKTVLGHCGLHDRSQNIWCVLGTIFLIKTVLRCDPRLLYRLAKVFKTLKKELDRLCQSDKELKYGKFWFVDSLCISPFHQGKGIGTGAMSQILTRTFGTDKPVVLWTSKAINVKFFANLGFDIMSHVDIRWNGDAGRLIPVWFMKRPRCDVDGKRAFEFCDCLTALDDKNE